MLCFNSAAGYKGLTPGSFKLPSNGIWLGKRYRRRRLVDDDVLEFAAEPAAVGGGDGEDGGDAGGPTIDAEVGVM